MLQTLSKLAFEAKEKCPEPESNQWHEDFQSSALPTELSGHWVAGIGFEPMTFGLWARRASRLLHPALLYYYIFNCFRHSLIASSSQSNGWRWIRTTEAICSRFTVCPLWPLGNPSKFRVRSNSDPDNNKLYHNTIQKARNFWAPAFHTSIRLQKFWEV